MDFIDCRKSPYFQIPYFSVVLITAVSCFNSAADLPYGPYGTGSWPRDRGNHRALVRVGDNVDAVRVKIPWRRRDHNPEEKNIAIIHQESGDKVENLVRVSITREFGDLIFEPVGGPGIYEVYYMPYHHDGPPHKFKTVYEPIEVTDVDAGWLSTNVQAPSGLPLKGAEGLPEAEVVAIQARTEQDRMDPMEVIATRAEIRALLDEHGDSPYLCFPEDRRHPIRMRRDIPFRWVENGPSLVFEGKPCRNEFYVFQVGIFAAREDVVIEDARFSELRAASGGDTIGPESFRCFNLGGTDWADNPFHKDVAVEQGTVQPLWFGVQIPAGIAPSRYSGKITIVPRELEAAEITVHLDVQDDVLEHKGDADLWRLARLRWLDSTTGSGDAVIPPYTPLQREGRTIRCLGRTLTFTEGGLPESIVSNGIEILAGQVTMYVQPGRGGEFWDIKDPVNEVLEETGGAIEWQGVRDGEPLTSRCRVRMEPDGYIDFEVTGKTNARTEVRDIYLEIPIRKEIATYMMGMGRKGGYRPAKWRWEWDIDKADNTLWIGDVNAGLYLKIKDKADSWNLYNHRGTGLPETWANGGEGYCEIEERGDRVVTSVHTGPMMLAMGTDLEFHFGMLITPVKPLDPDHWNWRYFHRYAPVNQAVSAGCNIINIHHGNEINPYINYPFLTEDKLAEYVSNAHQAGVKVKIYYTVRELSTFAPELWALRSLGHEIFTDGPGGGCSWLCEHLVDDYQAAWHHPGLPGGRIDRAIATTGLSRGHNYYLEGLAWLLDNAEIDGLYLDGIGYDRKIMKRVRRIMQRLRPGSLIDFHSGNNFHPDYGMANCACQYMEHFPYIDSLWFGEGFDYNESPDYWLVEISGIPFGLFGEMLQGGGNPWRGMLYGMTNRYGWGGDPRAIWRVWDEFGICEAKMKGYWDAECPVDTGRDDILATAYCKPDKALVAVASWADETVDCTLDIDWDAIGLEPENSRLRAPAIEGFQQDGLFQPGEPLPVEPARGMLLVLENVSEEDKAQ